MLKFRALLLGMALVPLVLQAQGGPSGTPPRVSAPGVYSGYSQQLYDQFVRTNFYVEARDGVRLAVTLYQPARNGVPVDTPYPALLSLTPYRRLYREADGTFGGWEAEPDKDQRGIADLTHYGYVVAVADVRGKGASFGVRWAYQDDNEARDGYDLVEWLARQSYTTGKIGMFGCSYVGGTQLATARLAPPHLRAIFPQAAPFDSYRMASKGGISGQFNTRYQSNEEDIGTVPVDADPDGKLAEQARAEHARNGQMLDMINTLPYRDDHDPVTDIAYWQVVSPYRNLAAIEASGIAVYHWGNWFDEVSDQSLISYATLKHNPRKLMMGTGTHCEVGPIDMVTEHLRYFDHYLKGIDNGIDREPPVYFRTLGKPAGQDWSFSPTWPPPGVHNEAVYLSSRPSGTLAKTAFDGSLVAARNESKSVPYAVDYNVSCHIEPRFDPGFGKPRPGNEGKPQPGYWPCVLDSIGATFTGTPLAKPLTLIGTPVIRLKLSASTDVNVFVYLETISADGTVEIISHGRLKASGRKLSDPPYDNLGLPWSSNNRADAQPVIPGQPFEMRFTLSPTAILIPTGTRLRVTVTGADLRQRNLEQIKVNPPPQIDLRTGKDGSFLLLPVAARG